MEIHHHPDVHHKKKNFKEYFLEFLMIFLAVTLGFFAENLREYFKNQDEINSDMRSMIADLQSDVAMFDADFELNQLSDLRTDTLISLLKLNRSNTSHIYFLARFITANNFIYTPDTRTFDQMKSSGSLKLIESRSIVDSISSYYQSLQFFNSQSDLQRQKVDEVHSVNSELFDGYTFQQMFTKVNSKGDASSTLDIGILQPKNNPALLSNNFNVVNKIIVTYHYLYATTEINNEVAILSRQHAEQLIKVLKKEYHLK